jgi:hypothetical protein
LCQRSFVESMTLPSNTPDKILRIYLSLADYPVLAPRIRTHMRAELFQRGVISPQAFETEAREKAIRSQAREAIHNPFGEETADVWNIRLDRVRDHLTDFYFAYNLPYDLFEQIVRRTLMDQGAEGDDLLVSFNPELAPQPMLFEHAAAIEKLSADKRTRFEARLQEVKVVLIRTLISDQLAYVHIAREWFSISDLNDIRRRKIGQGKIGGKTAGMLLAARILNSIGGDEIRQHLRIPESYYMGADISYDFVSFNNLAHWNDQKYKPEAQIRAEHPLIQKDFLNGEFPPESRDELRRLLGQIGPRPIIVRSSSLLEDNFGTSFAGKYESHFCPNQGTLDDNLFALTQAISRIYASMFNPDALLYRRAKELLDYDERMAILIQVVEGQQFGRYYLPEAAGVAFSRNLFRWSPQIRREDGFVRLVWGLGTRAVDRVGNDYPRMVALSHPLLYPESSPELTLRYSQQFVDLLDLEDNQFKTLPVHEVLSPQYPSLSYLAQADEGGYLTTLRSSRLEGGTDHLVLTFHELLRRTPLARLLREMLQILEKQYHSPVDTEFTIRIIDPHALQPEVEICLLQCRPQSRLKDSDARLPIGLHPSDIIFATRGVVPQGYVAGIDWVLFVSPEEYFTMPTPAARAKLGYAISQLNNNLKDEVFICIGPGRWGTNNPDLGVHIAYGDIYNTRALVELSGSDIGMVATEPSFGTHFFQDLVEANIYPLAIPLDDEGVSFNRSFFYDTPNCLVDWIPEYASLADSLRLIAVDSYRPGCHLDLVMDDEQSRAVAFLVPD